MDETERGYLNYMTDENTRLRQQNIEMLEALKAVREGYKSYQREKLDVAMKFVEQVIADAEGRSDNG